jgi:hypothetical protein
MWIETKYYLVKENRLSDLGLDNLEDEELTTDFAFDTKNVESFRKLIDEDDNEVEDEVFVHFKSGLGIILAMSYSSLMKAIITTENVN